jgi:hypothetical protein
MKRAPLGTAGRMLSLMVATTIGAAPTFGHHSWSRYDGDNVIMLTGTITSVEWASPHVVMHFTVPAESGEPTAWTMEMDPPTLLSRYGLRHDVLMPGMRVKLTGVPARSGAPMMRAVTIETEDGTVYRVSSRV